ncbi:SPFH domain-containing protein [bacterium]|nr:SPFH domain-containing protein [bacterium]
MEELIASGIIFFFIILIPPLLIIIFSSFFIVKQQESALVEFLGKFNRIAPAGLHFKIPVLERVSGKVSLRIEQLDTKVETKTRDNVFTNIVVSVQFYINPDKVYDAFYRLENPRQQISSFVFDSVRAQVPLLNLDDVFEKKDDIAVQLKTDLDEVMADFGFVIFKALVTDIDPDAKVKSSMNEINAQNRLKEAAKEKAEARKIEVVKAAEADAESKKLQGVGVAEQRKAIIEGYRESVENFQTEIAGVDASDVMLLVLMTQYFDTMKDLADKSTTKTIFASNAPSATGDIMSQMRDAFMQAKEVNEDLKPHSSPK